MFVFALVAILLAQSTFALRILPQGVAKPNSQATFKVVNDLQGSPVRLQVHDSDGNILSNSEGVTNGPIQLYIPQTDKPTYLVATKLSDKSSTTQPLIIGSN